MMRQSLRRPGSMLTARGTGKRPSAWISSSISIAAAFTGPSPSCGQRSPQEEELPGEGIAHDLRVLARAREGEERALFIRLEVAEPGRQALADPRSEERRVGKECRSRW